MFSHVAEIPIIPDEEAPVLINERDVSSDPFTLLNVGNPWWISFVLTRFLILLWIETTLVYTLE